MTCFLTHGIIMPIACRGVYTQRLQLGEVAAEIEKMKPPYRAEEYYKLICGQAGHCEHQLNLLHSSGKLKEVKHISNNSTNIVILALIEKNY